MEARGLHWKLGTTLSPSDDHWQLAPWIFIVRCRNGAVGSHGVCPHRCTLTLQHGTMIGWPAHLGDCCLDAKGSAGCKSAEDAQRDLDKRAARGDLRWVWEPRRVPKKSVFVVVSDLVRVSNGVCD